jgi:acyl dehydratase
VQDDVAHEGRLHHEDLAVGQPLAFGCKTVSAQEIIAFGRAFDPQPLHVEEGVGLCASGLHVCAMLMRMFCDGLLQRAASQGSPGVDEVRWMAPVRPGDALSARYTVQQKRDLASRSDVGIAKVLVELLSEGRAAASWITNQLTRRRHAGSAAAARSPKGPRLPRESLWDDPATALAPSPAASFEDYRVGDVIALGRHSFGRDEIIQFARRFDPQPFHVDAAAGRASLFGGLCASGWHTAAICTREAVLAGMGSIAAPPAEDGKLPDLASSLGWRDLQWPRPVYVDDTIEFRGRLARKIDLASRPHYGIVTFAVAGRNQRGETVLAFTSQALVRRRRP